MRLISNVLFDLDGTLTDSKDGITRCIQYSLACLGREAPATDHLSWCIGPPLRDSFTRLLGSTDEVLLDSALEFYRERFADIGMYENAVYPGIIQALQQLQGFGFQLFLATSKPAVFAARILDHFNLTRFFHGIFGSETDGRLSDKSDLIAHILDTRALDPRESLMVGDRSYDVVGGKSNGTMTAMVTYGYATRCEIDAADPDYIFNSPSDLTEFLLSGV